MRVVNKRSGEKGVYVGRPSALGNPFSHLPGTLAEHRVKDRDEAVFMFGHWILARIREKDQRVMTALRELSEDSVLVCWCAPEPCHAEVIARAWAWARKEGLL